MTDPTRLEKAILNIVVGLSVDDWVSLTMGTLRNRLSDILTDANLTTSREIVACICSLESRSLIGLRKCENASYSPFTRARAMEEQYCVQFFWIGPFELKITHEGRTAIAVTETKPVTTSAPSTDDLDDRLPLLRTKSFEPDLDRYAKEALDSGFPMALVIIDVDNFGQFNKLHSLKVGNEVLIAVADALNDRTRGKGKAYRYGGDEMAILLPNYFKPEAITLAEIIRLQVEKSSVTEKKLQVTISLGVASLPEDAPDGKGLFNAANEALLSAKKLGPNLVRAVGDPDKAEEIRKPARKQPSSAGGAPLD